MYHNLHYLMFICDNLHNLLFIYHNLHNLMFICHNLQNLMFTFDSDRCDVKATCYWITIRSIKSIKKSAVLLILIKLSLFIHLCVDIFIKRLFF